MSMYSGMDLLPTCRGNAYMDLSPRPIAAAFAGWHLGAMATHLKTVTEVEDPLAGVSLPGWLYHDPGFFEAEKRAFLRASPQIVCHVSDIAEPGQWQKIDYLGESIIVMRGDDGVARAFANVCRHRGSQLVDG